MANKFCQTIPFFCKFLFFLILSACIQEDLMYKGNPLTKPKYYPINNDYGYTETAVKCQELCQKTAKCQWFNWGTDKHCYLNKGKGEERHKYPGGSTGPAYCEWKKGYCLDENKIDQNWGGMRAPKAMSAEDCLNWCKQRSLATGCEYHLASKNCLAHTFSVSSASGGQDYICAVFLPEGLFMILSKRTLFMRVLRSYQFMSRIIKNNTFLAQ